MIIIDTNVVSELMRLRPNPTVLAWVNAQTADCLFTTAITKAEVFVGIATLPIGKKRETLASAADMMFNQRFSDRVLAFDASAADTFATLVATRKKGGRPISLFDAQIAAIVLASDAHLATRNVSDFIGCGFDVIDPWN